MMKRYKSFLNFLCIIFLIQVSTCALQGKALIDASSLPSYQLIGKIKSFLGQHGPMKQSSLDHSGNMAALLLVEKSQSILSDIIDGFNQGTIHNLMIEKNFMQAYGLNLPAHVRPKDLRFFSKKIAEFDLFLNDFIRQKRWSLTAQELALINKIQQLNVLLTKGVLHSDFLPIETGDYVTDVLWYRPCEFAARHKILLACTVGALCAAGLSYYVVYPQLVRWSLGNKNPNFKCHQFAGCLQGDNAKCGYYALLHAMLMIKADGDRNKVEQLIVNIKKNGLDKKIVQEMEALIAPVLKEKQKEFLQANECLSNQLILASTDQLGNLNKIDIKNKKNLQDLKSGLTNLSQEELKNTLTILSNHVTENDKKKFQDALPLKDKETLQNDITNEIVGIQKKIQINRSNAYKLSTGEWLQSEEIRKIVSELDTIKSIKEAGLALKPEEKNLLSIEDAYADGGSILDVDEATQQRVLDAKNAGKASIMLSLGNHWIAVYLPNADSAWVIDSYIPGQSVWDTIKKKVVPSLFIPNQTNNRYLNDLLSDYKEKEIVPSWYVADVQQKLDNIGSIYAVKNDNKWSDQDVGTRLFRKLYEAAQGLNKPDRKLVLNKCQNDFEAAFQEAKNLYNGPILNNDEQEVVSANDLQAINSFAELFQHVIGQQLVS